MFVHTFKGNTLYLVLQSHCYLRACVSKNYPENSPFTRQLGSPIMEFMIVIVSFIWAQELALRDTVYRWQSIINSTSILTTPKGGTSTWKEDGLLVKAARNSRHSVYEMGWFFSNGHICRTFQSKVMVRKLNRVFSSADEVYVFLLRLIDLCMLCVCSNIFLKGTTFQPSSLTECIPVDISLINRRHFSIE